MAVTARLLLFDIDGTLLLSGGAGGRAMTRAFAETFGHPEAFAGVSMAGRTDGFLLDTALARTGMTASEAARDRFRTLYLTHLAHELEQPGTGRHGLLPGVDTLLAELGRRPEVHLALVTGNYRDGARLKLARVGLWDRFPWGAFADDAVDRNALVPVALARATAHGVPAMPPHQITVIGDTRFDVECARAGGVRAVGVATGGASRGDLEASGADLVLDDLTDVGRLLHFLDVPPA